MRILFAVAPAIAHLFPMVTLAHAARAAGHEVVVATAGPAVDGAVRAGLPVVDAAPDTDFGAVFGKSTGTADERARQARERGRAMAELGATPDFILERFGKVSDLLADTVLAFARSWRPDLVVHSRVLGAGLLAARDLGVPAVEHGFGFLREPDLPGRFLPHLEPMFARHGVPLELPRVHPLHIAPPSLMIGAPGGRQMRFVPYNAGGVLPNWLGEPAQRPRIAVTLGTTVPQMAGFGAVQSVLAAAGAVDAEFVLALGADPDLDEVGPIPANVRLIGWVPLNNLLTACDAIVHHGGSGTVLTTIAAGLPHLSMPHGADDFINADLVARNGMGLNLEPGEVDAAALERLAHDEALRVAARAAADELAAQTPPSEVVPVLAALAEGKDEAW
ncbi:glycosyltransferase [Actinokineospora sp. G85]|uniref:glycosyltransferase n=1 Tax=Actinokineospora sp. G85 TaxID=3406626 RepID=UPI003C73B7D7